MAHRFKEVDKNIDKKLLTMQSNIQFDNSEMRKKIEKQLCVAEFVDNDTYNNDEEADYDNKFYNLGSWLKNFYDKIQDTFDEQKLYRR